MTVGENASRNARVIVAAFAALGALLAASCCVLPLALTSLGLGGSWLVILAPFTVYRDVILIVAAVVVFALWWHLRRKERRAVVPVTLAALATVSLGLALTRAYWEAPTMQALWSAWRHG